MVDKKHWIWLGTAGHFIGSRHCQFRLNTHIGNFRVSTVGEYLDSNGEKMRLGAGEDPFYETMVFKLGDKKCSCGCGRRDPDSLTEIDRERGATLSEAQEMHMRMCEKYAKGENQ